MMFTFIRERNHNEEIHSHMGKYKIRWQIQDGVNQMVFM
jgi:hypothetical protein